MSELSPDALLSEMVEYVSSGEGIHKEAYSTARLCTLDALGCALAALSFPACVKILGPVVDGMAMRNGARVPGTTYELDPVTAAFDLGAMIRWLDFNDTWLALEWAHPSDNLGAILSVADYLARNPQLGIPTPTMRDVFLAMIQTYEIQGGLGMSNSLNRMGYDHVAFVRIASSLVATRMMGGSQEQILNALSNAWMDGAALRAYRHAPNTGSRKSWAAGDAASRAVWFAFLAMRGEMGYPNVLTTPRWGVADVLFKEQPVTLAQPLGSYVMENILFKVTFPAEFHAQTAVEAAILLHPQVKIRISDIERVEITTQESAMRIIDKTGPLHNPADRDHCIQYMTAIGLLNGALTANDYEDESAADPRIDALRSKMICVEDQDYSKDYLDPHKRSIANAVQVFFRDGTSTEKVAVEYPLGHRRRRAEAIPLLQAKFAQNAQAVLSAERIQQILRLLAAPDELDSMPVDQFVTLFLSGK